MARDLVAEIRDTDQRLKTLTAQIADTLDAHGTRLREVDGIGPVIAGRLLGRTRRAGRFRSASAFANYAGVAPIEVASGDHARHRLPRGGDRQLNLALHVIALTQVRMRDSTGRAYYDTQIAAGKIPQRGHALFETPPGQPGLATHARRRTPFGGRPGRTLGGDSDIQRGWLNPDHQLFGQVTSRTRRHNSTTPSPAA